MSKDNDTYASVWDAIADTAEEAANLRVRSELMGQLAAIIKSKRWTQAEAADRCGVTQPRINDLLRGRMSRFSLDALVNVAAALGQRVRLELDAASRARRRANRPIVAASRREQIAAKGGASHRKPSSAIVARRA